MIRSIRILFSPIAIFAALILGAVAALLLIPSLHAQVVGGTISGTVADATGAAIPNAQVLVHNDETGNERKLITGPDGRFSAPSIPVGSYSISVTAEGFATQTRKGVPLSVGQSQDVPFTLSVSGVSESVIVRDEPPIVNTSTQQTSGLVDERQVKELPLNGRSYDQLVTLNPATVNYTAQRSGSVGTSNSSVGNMFAVSGRRPQDNLYLLNGVEYTGASLINVTPGGTSGQLLGVEAVREFNVITDTYSATYGKRTGAQVSIVTASGTNRLHGSAYEFLRNSLFDARNYFDPGRIPEFQRNDFGGALGGPIKKDKLFLFANYEGYRQNLGVTDVTLVPDNNARQGNLPGQAHINITPAVAGLLNLWPVQNGPELLTSSGGQTGIGIAYGSAPQHIREDFGTARFDANLTPNDLLFAVYTIDDSTAHTPSQNPLSLVDERLREQVASIQAQHVFTPNLLNTARAGLSRASFYFLGSVPDSVQALTPTFLAGKPTGAVVISGSTASNGASTITAAGANVGSNNGTTRNLFTFDDHIYWTHGRQQIEAGGWGQLLESNDNLAQDQYGQASFSTLTSFLQGSIATFTYAPQTTEIGWRSKFIAAYLEDTIKLRPNLELRAGLRTESTDGWNASHGRAAVYGFTNGVIDTNPAVGSSALTTNRAKFLPEPRVGLSYDPFSTGRTVIRASAGLHRALLDTLDYRLDQSAPFNTVYSVKSSSVANPTGGAGSSSSVSPSTVQPDLSTPSVIAWTLRVEQQVAKNTSLTIGYVGSHGYHQILSEDLNEPASVVLPNGAIYYPAITKPNPALANTTSWVSQGSSSYNGLEVDLRHTLTRGVAFRGNYTYSKNLDDGSAWNTSVSANTPAFVSYPNNPALDWGPAATDVRHIGQLNASYDLPFGHNHFFLAGTSPIVNGAVSGWTLSTIATLETGFPFSPQLGYNPTGSGDSRNPVRPDINPAFGGQRYTSGTTAQRVAQFFHPAAFSAPAYGTVGNASRDLLTGPAYNDLDASLTKVTPLGESARLQFRAEFFNILNHTNLGTPSETVFASGPTQGTTANQTAAVTLSPTAGVITSAGTSRQIQFGLKLLF